MIESSGTWCLRMSCLTIIVDLPSKTEGVGTSHLKLIWVRGFKLVVWIPTSWNISITSLNTQNDAVGRRTLTGVHRSGVSFSGASRERGYWPKVLWKARGTTQISCCFPNCSHFPYMFTFKHLFLSWGSSGGAGSTEAIVFLQCRGDLVHACVRVDVVYIKMYTTCNIYIYIEREIYVYVYMYECMCIYIYIHTYIHIYICAYTCIYTHTNTACALNQSITHCVRPCRQVDIHDVVYVHDIHDA